MAILGAAGAVEPPRYLHEAAAVVPLAWPFELDGRSIDRVELVHPSLDGLEFLRGEGALSARLILQVTSTLPLRAIGGLRWPDVETILAAAMTLLPPDLTAQVDEPEDGAKSANGEAEEPAVGSEADVAAQLDLNPGDFAVSI
jgi:hypothetical protein